VKKVFSLNHAGSTALGPALAASVGLASRVSGSEVILCTDGLPNLGIGRTGSGSFYTDIGTFAKNSGITISILGIEGADCGVRNLSACADLSGGNVNVVNPLELTRQMRMIIDNPAIATEVQLSAFLPKGFIFKNPDRASKEPFILLKDIGTITGESDITLEYGIEQKDKADKVLSKAERVPFQLQIKYTKKDKSKHIRIVNAWLNITGDRTVAQKDCNVSILGLNAIQQTAKIGQTGNANAARSNLLGITKVSCL
jgi:hypothetical protein